LIPYLSSNSPPLAARRHSGGGRNPVI
jgi:hypothetical protein